MILTGANQSGKPELSGYGSNGEKRGNNFHWNLPYDTINFIGLDLIGMKKRWNHVQDIGRR
jgi:hypothetical protein